MFFISGLLKAAAFTNHSGNSEPASYAAGAVNIEKTAISGKWFKDRFLSGAAKRLGSLDAAMTKERIGGLMHGYDVDRELARLDSISSLKKFHGPRYRQVIDVIKKSNKAVYLKHPAPKKADAPKTKKAPKEVPYTKGKPRANKYGQYSLFTKSLKKTAALTNHLDGAEWKITDTEPAPYAAGAVKAKHQPTFKYDDTNEKHSKNDHLDASVAARAVLKKKASSHAGGLDHVGTKSDAADTIATQLKWETSGDEFPQNLGYNLNKYQAVSPRGRKKGQKK